MHCNAYMAIGNRATKQALCTYVLLFRIWNEPSPRPGPGSGHRDDGQPLGVLGGAAGRRRPRRPHLPARSQGKIGFL